MYPITLTKQLDDIEICGMRLKDLEHPDFEYPWEIIAWQRENALKIVELRITDYELREKNVYVGKNVAIDQFVIFNTDQGVIIIDDCAHVYPFSYIEGPCYIGAHTEIKSHSQIRKNTSIGHHCKIGGEVSGSIFQPYTNKAHHGFVGDSYIGSWVNLGAGTTNSDLKNTYGEIKMKGEKTGHQFLGCVIADYAKTAVGALIYTGKVIGFNSCVYGTAIADVPSFTNYARYGAKQITFPLELAQKTQIAMFSRRNVSPNKACQDLLKHIFSLTAAERNAAGVREGELNFIV